MKIVWLFLFLILSSGISYSQNYTPAYYDFFRELYIDRQPSAKAQSMGGGLVANTNNDFGSYYNPALTSLSQGLTFNTSFSGDYKDYENSKFNYYGASYNFRNVGTFGLSRYSYYNVNTFTSLIYNGSEYVEQKYVIENRNFIYTLNYSREMLKNFYAGVNLNIVYSSYIDKNSVPIDIGLLFKFPVISSSQKFSNLFQMGAAYYNINKAQYTTGGGIDPEYFVLPSIVSGEEVIIYLFRVIR
ncbi:MAG: hypothetical protein JST55_03370 [Bacteroidetes bacterium]|nr:hypothetical protein [Bacteroidota bacterium]